MNSFVYDVFYPLPYLPGKLQYLLPVLAFIESMENLLSAILLFRNVHEQMIKKNSLSCIKPKLHHKGDPKSRMLSTTR